MNLTEMVRAIVREEIAAHQVAGDPEQHLTTREVAELTGLSEAFFVCGRSQGIEGRPPYRKIGRRVLYRRSDVESWMQGRERK